MLLVFFLCNDMKCQQKVSTILLTDATTDYNLQQVIAFEVLKILYLTTSYNGLFFTLSKTPTLKVTGSNPAGHTYSKPCESTFTGFFFFDEKCQQWQVSTKSVNKRSNRVIFSPLHLACSTANVIAACRQSEYPVRS